MADRTFIVQDVTINHHPKPAHYDDISLSFAQAHWADAYLFIVGIWAVKGSFLAYYDGLTQRLTYHRRAWWAVIALTIATCIGNLFAYAFLDGLHFGKDLKNEALKYQFSVDLTTDVLSRYPNRIHDFARD
ncbi:hypothetical protein ACLMJK_007482 [Lecanora helva]